MRVHNRSRCAILADRALTATGTPPPVQGLIGQPPPRDGEALVIWTPGGSRSAGNPGSVDLVFVGTDGHIVSCARGVSPSRVVPAATGARLVIELPAGTVERSGTEIGDYIEFS
ncbi:MAG: DUF192 domain-containing protein [Anaerolineae bacterium]